MTKKDMELILTRAKKMSKQNMTMRAALKRIMKVYKAETFAYMIAERALK
jgi:hypothetical protein